MKIILLFLVIVLITSETPDIQNQGIYIKQKNLLDKCISNSDKLRKDFEKICGDFEKNFNRHKILEIFNKVIDCNPENKKIFEKCINDSDDVVLTRGFSFRPMSMPTFRPMTPSFRPMSMIHLDQ